MTKYDKGYFEDSYKRVFKDKDTDDMGYKALARLSSGGCGQGGLALEVGCGLGTLSYRLAEYWKKVIGVDVSGFAIEKARQLYGSEKLIFMVADGINLPFGDGTIDCVAISSVFEHLTDEEAQRVQKEAYRVLKKDGFLVAGVPSPIGKSWIDIFLAGLKSRNRNLSFYTRRAIKRTRRASPGLDVRHLTAIGDPTHKRIYSTSSFAKELAKGGFCEFQFGRRRLFRIIFFGSQKIFKGYVKLYLAAPDIIRKIFFIDIGSSVKAKKRG